MSWNVCGIGTNAASLDSFLGIFGGEQPWDILTIQEMSFERKPLGLKRPRFESDSIVIETASGHVAFAQVPHVGQRMAGIVMHSSQRTNIVNGSFKSIGRSCSFDLQWDGNLFRVVSAHLWPNRELDR